MFKQNHPRFNIDSIGSRLEEISNVLKEAGVVTSKRGSEGVDYELTRFRQNIMGFAAAGAPFGRIEMFHAESNTLLTIDIAFDVFYSAEYRLIKADKADYDAPSEIDYVYLNRNLAIAAGLA